MKRALSLVVSWSRGEGDLQMWPARGSRVFVLILLLISCHIYGISFLFILRDRLI